jgi:hypothetical protein
MKHLIIYFLLINSVIYGQTFPGESIPAGDAELFSPGNITTLFNERDFAISPDGKEIFYTLMINNASRAKIVTRKLVNGKWQPAEEMPFSGPYHDIEPALSADGNKLFFSSTRELTGDGTKDHDIWVSTRTNGIWSAPINLGAPVNTSNDEFYPSVATSGTLYWTANYTNGAGDEDIWFATVTPSGYATPKLLPFNTARDEFNAFVDPDEKFVLYSIFGRGDELGHGDVYISTKSADGTFSQGAHLNLNINSISLDYSPYVSQDKKLMFFTSERKTTPPADLPSDPFSPKTLIRKIAYPVGGSNIYWIDFGKLN